MTLCEWTEVDLKAPPQRRRGSWADYIEGIARCLDGPSGRLTGADLVINSDVPVGAGLSSSAALEIAAGLALLAVSNCQITSLELALAAQRAEHEFVGTRCGIMDQLICATGRTDCALLLDCRSHEAAAVPMKLQGAVVLICDTGVKHELAASAYNERRAECEDAVRRLARHLPGIKALRDVSESDIARVGSVLPERLLRRARHIVTENARTLAAADALRADRPDVMGRLMLASHASLRDDFVVSAPELDLLVACAEGLEGAYGARMTGGGFGGCAVALVAAAAVTRVARSLGAAFQERFGRAPGLFVTRATDGGRELT
jgi:galactokinase